MKVTYLGQGGLLFDFDGTLVIVDPYLSNSVEKIQPENKRRVAVDESFLKLKPDIILLTHNHLDHTDPETLKHYLSKDSSVTVLASHNAWNIVRSTFGGIKNNYVSFNVGTVWTEKGIVFEAVYAEHSDEYAIGVLITYNDKTYYVTGDTLYNKKVIDSITKKVDYVFLPVNGRGNNLNFVDGKNFCEKLGAVAVPIHCGLFDEIDLSDFPYENKVVPKFYKEIDL
ncbi:MAG: MBL fold metallo-hydrolase [Clostridia bacterium]|nr:MBL fold metallo-hydrolase [Clostridia bacterium]